MYEIHHSLNDWLGISFFTVLCLGSAAYIGKRVYDNNVGVVAIHEQRAGSSSASSSAAKSMNSGLSFSSQGLRLFLDSGFVYSDTNGARRPLEHRVYYDVHVSGKDTLITPWPEFKDVSISAGSLKEYFRAAYDACPVLNINIPRQ